MPWDYTSPDSIPVRTTTTLNVDRVVAGRLTIIFAEKVIFFQLDRGPISGSGVDKKDEITYNPVEASYDAIMAAVTNDSETLGDALERILLGQANTDGDLPAGSIS
jgi:hypothetical protein